MPLRKYGVADPLLVSVLPRCHGLACSQKNTSMPVAMRNTSCSAIADRFGGVVVLEVHEHDAAAAAFHQRPDGGLVEGCRDEVAAIEVDEASGMTRKSS